jgi:putative ABC transport system substrate-binding protein
VNRRQAIAALGVFATMGRSAPLFAQAAKPPRWRVGLLSWGANEPSGECRRIPKEFRQWSVPLLLEDFGMLEGRDFALDYRCPDGTRHGADNVAQRLVEATPDVIVATGPDLIPPVRRATDRIPIVMLYGPDPIAQGWARSYGRPGGNLTGSTFEIDQDESFNDKIWELIREIRPGSKTFVHVEMADHAMKPQYDLLRDRFGRRFGVKIQTVGIPTPSAIQDAFRRIAALKPGAMSIIGDSFTIPNRREILKEARATRLPIYGWDSGSIESRPGYLVAYSTDVRDQPRRAAEYVAKILRGAKPGDLPIVRPTKAILQVNLKVARELGITVPPTVLLRADRVIE